MPKITFAVVVTLVLIHSPISAETTMEPFNVTIDIRVHERLGELRPIWRFFGADEPNYAHMKDGRKLLGELGKIGTQPKYFRAHNLLTSGDGTPALKWGSTNAYTEDERGNPVYDWSIIDRIFDTYLASGVRPFAQIGFMPKDLSTNPLPYQHEWRPGLPYEQIITGWAFPPKDYDKWRELCFQWARHCVERYGREEVEQWYWEVWNEANGHYWRGTAQEWYKLHDYAIDGVRRALPTARVGGPHSAGSGGKFTRDFLEHCLRGRNHATGEIGTPLDFVAFHAKGRPTFVDGHVRMGIADHLREIDKGFGLIAEFPELKQTPVILGESDPEGCAACQGPHLRYRNGTMYSSYTAASFARKHQLAERHGVNFEGAVTWAFEFEDQPYFAGFRALATNAIDLPVLNVFRLFGMMSGRRLPVVSSQETPLDAILDVGVRGQPDVTALASIDGDTIFVLAWHYHDDDVPAPDAIVTLRLLGLGLTSRSLRMTRYLIDDNHSNAFAEWRRMGSPIAPNAEQYAQLKAASRLATAAAPMKLDTIDGEIELKLNLPRQAVTLLVLEQP